jgi:predicted enzyme related to lactoylglutathione lyase
VEVGGAIAVPAFDIAVSRCALVRDPDGNVLVLLDMSKGPLRTDPGGNVIV